MEIVMNQYWVVLIEYSQTDHDYVVVKADTRQQAEQFIRDNGCNAKYINALYKAKVLN
jgi:hypothetical protein